MHASAIGHGIVGEVLARLRDDRQFMRDVSDWQRAPARPARFAGFPPTLDPRLRTALQQRGIEQLYTHQAQAIEAALNREHVVVVARAAGGKSLCFYVPILAALLDDPGARALCLFPTKALGQDQLAHLSSFVAALPGLDERAKRVGAYDGDTPQNRRAEVRRDARVLITNADMLHMGILPHHTRWAMFFRNLRYVVIDEMHAYRGVFGSHVANVIRRLKRLCAFHGSSPTFILASATIANPREHAERLIEAPVALVDDDGSPHGERNVIIVNPPITDPELGLRRSADFVARDIAARFIAEGLQTICFARSRNAAEVLLTYLRDACSQAAAGPGAANGKAQPAACDAGPAIRGYRGGYLPEERRSIEQGLRQGSVRGVVATNALELGVDIGSLDACVMLGYPGSIASFWQQAGRAGRRQSASVAVMVATPDPLDQYLAAHPEYLFRQSPEHARIAPDHLGVLAAHVTCATFELPFRRGERLSNARVDELLDALADEGEVHVSGVGAMPLFRAAGRPDAQLAGEDRNSELQYTWVGQGYPADRVSLRSVGDRVSIVDERGELIGETERSTASARVHPGAVYLHQAETYLVTELDWELGRAIARRVDVDYYTQASAVSEVMVVRAFGPPAGAGAPAVGEIEVTTTVSRYRQVQFNTHRTLGWGDVDLPAQKLLTIGYWFAIPEAVCQQLEREGILGRPNDYGPNWEQQRQAARARDAYRCVICGKPEGLRQQHHVHHRRPFRTFGYVRGENDHYLQANDLDNLMTVCATCHARIETAGPVNQALGGLCYALASLAPIFVMCDTGDIAAAFDPANAHTRLPTITLYELTPGAGLAEELLAHHAELLQMAAQRVRECPCEHGCPSCIGPMPTPAEPHEPNLKRRVARLIELIA